MSRNSPETAELLRRARTGDRSGLGDLLSRYTDRLRRLIDLRVHRDVRTRIDANDVLQEVFIEAMRDFGDYEEHESSSFYLWFRTVALRKLMEIHRFHLGVQARDPRREISIYRGEAPVGATSHALAARLVGQGTSPSEAAVLAERRLLLEEALESMDPLDREVIALRHFERLTNAEIGEVLGVSEAAAAKRHGRALVRLREVLDVNPE